jgi:hypothetical protein
MDVKYFKMKHKLPIMGVLDLQSDISKDKRPYSKV